MARTMTSVASGRRYMGLRPRLRLVPDTPHANRGPRCVGRLTSSSKMKLFSTAAAVMAFDTSGAGAFQAVVMPSPARSAQRSLSSASSSRLTPWMTTRRRPAAAPRLCASQTSDVTATSESTEAKGKSKGHGKMSRPDKNSFVQWDMRRAAMKLHTRDQAPKEGKKETKGVAFSEWQPSRRGYTQFLVDSKVVYTALEEACSSDPRLADFQDSGLERTEALEKDIAWMLETYPDASTSGVGGAAPEPTEAALEYAAFLQDTVASSVPAFMCHYYNHYFAHTAGGRMIGRKVAESCLDGRTLEFYQWGGRDVKVLLDAVRKKIDDMAKGWTEEEKEACVAETGRSFQYGGRLLSSITS